MGKFQVFENDWNGMKWRLRSGNNRTLAESGHEYRTRAECERDIELVRRMNSAEFYELGAEYRWRYRDEGGRIIAESAYGYPGLASCARAVETVRRIVPEATVESLLRERTSERDQFDDRIANSAVQQAAMPSFEDAHDMTATPFAAERGAVDIPLSVRFDGSICDLLEGTLVAFDWDFGDGVFGEGSVIDHTFPVPGVFPVALTVTNDIGASETIVQTIEIDLESGIAIVTELDPYAASFETAENLLFDESGPR